MRTTQILTIEGLCVGWHGLGPKLDFWGSFQRWEMTSVIGIDSGKTGAITLLKGLHRGHPATCARLGSFEREKLLGEAAEQVYRRGIMEGAFVHRRDHAERARYQSNLDQSPNIVDGHQGNITAIYRLFGECQVPNSGR